MSRPYGYDEGYQDGYEVAETNKDAEIAGLKEAAQAVVRVAAQVKEGVAFASKRDSLILTLAKALENDNA
jgi:hypothetical protein